MEQAAERIAEPRRPLAKDDVSDLGRIPPQSLDAERSVLGAMLLSRDAIATAVQHLDERAFYRETHRKIWRAMMALFDAQKSSPVDLVTLVEELKRRKELEVIGGAAYLTSLDQFVATAANVEHYCKIVNEKARRLGVTPENVFADFAGQTALGRFIEDSDVAHAVRFLVSEGARNVTGHDIVVDAGWDV